MGGGTATLPIRSAGNWRRQIVQHFPVAVFVLLFAVTCYVGSLLLLFGPAGVRGTYVELTGADVRPLTWSVVLTDLVLLNVATALLLGGWWLTGRVTGKQHHGAVVVAASSRARRSGLLALICLLGLEFARLGAIGSLSDLGAWHNYAALVAARVQVLHGLWFGDFVVIYTFIPLLVGFLFAELASGCWVSGVRAKIGMALLLGALLALNVAIFQKRPMIDALVIVALVAVVRIKTGPCKQAISLRAGALWFAGSVAAIYLVGILGPLFAGSAYNPSVTTYVPSTFSTEFENGAVGWTTATNNFVTGGARYYMSRGVSGIGLEVWARPGQGVSYQTSLRPQTGSEWLLKAWLRSDRPERTLVSLGVAGADAVSELQPTNSRWTLHGVCWRTSERGASPAIAFQTTRASRLFIDDVSLQPLVPGSCRQWSVAGNRLLMVPPSAGSVPRPPFLPPASSLSESANLVSSPAVTFPDPGTVGGSSHASILFLTPLIGFFTRTAGPAISYPNLYPGVFPYESVDVGLDRFGIGKQATDSLVSWQALFPLTPGGANAVPYMFALYAQGGLAIALAGSLLLGLLWRLLWMISYGSERWLVYRPAWLAMCVMFGVSLSGDSPRDAVFASGGIAWPLLVLLLIGAIRFVRLPRATLMRRSAPAT